MRLFISGIILLFSLSSFAESVTFRVPAFSGEFIIAGTGLEITGLSLEANLQFCNFWGTTCAGGPSKNISLDPSIDVYEKDGNTIVYVESTETVKFSSSELGHRFSSCKLNLKVYSIKGNEEVKTSYASLVWKNDESICKSEDAIFQTIENYFAQRNVHNRF